MLDKHQKLSIANLNEAVLIQLIVFKAGNEEFGVPIEQIREIIKISAMTSIPNSPNYIKGIINIRGEIVTTIDIRIRFNLSLDEIIEPKHIIVSKQEDGLFGLIVDEVVEVLRIQRGEIKPPPSLVTKINKKYINGVVSLDSRLIILLDLAYVLSQPNLLKKSSSNESKKIKIEIKKPDSTQSVTKRTKRQKKRS